MKYQRYKQKFLHADKKENNLDNTGPAVNTTPSLFSLKRIQAKKGTDLYKS